MTAFLQSKQPEVKMATSQNSPKAVKMTTKNGQNVIMEFWWSCTTGKFHGPTYLKELELEAKTMTQCDIILHIGLYQWNIEML